MRVITISGFVWNSFYFLNRFIFSPNVSLHNDCHSRLHLRPTSHRFAIEFHHSFKNTWKPRPFCRELSKCHNFFLFLLKNVLESRGRVGRHRTLIWNHRRAFCRSDFELGLRQISGGSMDLLLHHCYRHCLDCRNRRELSARRSCRLLQLWL